MWKSKLPLSSTANILYSDLKFFQKYTNNLIEHSDYFYLTLFAAIIISLIVITEGLAKREIVHKEIARKMLHLSAVLLAAYASIIFENYSVLIAAAGAATILTFFAVFKKLIPSIHQDRSLSWGIFFFPLSYFLLLLLLGKENKEIIALSFLILAFSDSFAAIIGTFISKQYFNLTGDKKSLIGSLTFFSITLIILVVIPREFNLLINDKISFTALTSIAIVVTIFEAISSKGFNNFIVPIISSLLLLIFVDNQQIQNQFVIGMGLSAVVAVISYKVKFLTVDGSAATFLLAGLIFGLGGWMWSLPILTFFILSSVLSKVRKKVNEEVELYFEKSSTRDYMQVVANGGIGGILVIVNQFINSDLIYLIYLSSLAAVCADTWATEIGTLKQTTTYNILNLKPVEQGISGGISLLGTSGAVLGAFVISLSGIFWIEFSFINYVLLIVFTGVAGSLFDSILGATIQAKNKCDVCNKITEKKHHCGEQTSHYNGLHWLNNDIVNLLAGLSGGILILVLVW